MPTSRKPPAWRAVLLPAAALWLAAAWPAAAQNVELDELERTLERNRAEEKALERKAKALQAEIDALQGELIGAARKAQDLEDALTAKERKLAELEARRSEQQDSLETRRGELARTLGALQRIALRPPEATIATSRSPVEALRSARLLSVAVPVIERRAEDLRLSLQGLERLHGQIAREQQDLAAAGQALKVERRRLAMLIERKQGLARVTKEQRQAAHARVRKLAQEAESLRDFLAKLERDALEREERQAREAAERAEQAAREAAERAEREAEQTRQAALSPPAAGVPLNRPGNVRPFPDSPDLSQLVLPARGRVVSLYGERETGDAVSKGISILTRGAAQVVAPYDGKVAYAGPFRGYGQILIIEHGGRYHTLLAGLDRVDAAEGQWVLAGEPVGTMSGTASEEPVLYLELRRTGQPINPLPWFANTNDKVQG